MSEKIPVKFSAGNEEDAALFCVTILAINDILYLHRGRFVIIVKQQHQDPQRIYPNYAMKFISQSHLRVILNRKFTFIRDGENKPSSGVPPLIVDAVLSNEYSFDVPIIRNLLTTPILQKNGDLFTNGHDATTNFYVAGFKNADVSIDYHGLALAQDAIRIIRNHFCGVTFASDLDLSVFLAALMTSFLCRQLGTKPAFAINAQNPGSGKSALVSAITTLALGDPILPMNHPKSERDFDKRLDQELRRNRGIISIDNITFPLDGARLCSVLSEPLVSLPASNGMSYAQVETAMLFLNGNDLKIASPDLARRTLIINLKKRKEADGEDQIGPSWIAHLAHLRPVLIVDMMGLLRAFAQAGRPFQVPALGSFEEWSRAVRDPIIWAGLPDPVQSQEQFAPRLMSRQRSVLQVLLDLTSGERFKASFLKDCVAEGKLSQGDLRAMLSVGQGALTTATIGQALHTLSAHPEGSLLIRRVGGHAGVNRWRIEPVSLN